MKLRSFLLLFFLTFISFSQNKVISKIENSKTLKGAIGSYPITLFVENKGIIDCDIYNIYINGWYYYDKYKIKIPLSGFINACDMKLYNYGKKHSAISKGILENLNSVKIDSFYEDANPEEALIFKICTTDKKNEKQEGSFKIKNNTSKIIINSENISLGREYEFFKLPNSKTIDLKKIFAGYGGNKFYSITQEKNEIRLIFYFESISNHNACGMCGASEGEKGYRIIYFDKNWRIKKTNEFLIESCLQNIYDTKIIKKSNTLIKYLIKNHNGKTLNHLLVNKSNSKIST